MRPQQPNNWTSLNALSIITTRAIKQHGGHDDFANFVVCPSNIQFSKIYDDFSAIGTSHSSKMDPADV